MSCGVPPTKSLPEYGAMLPSTVLVCGAAAGAEIVPGVAALLSTGFAGGPLIGVVWWFLHTELRFRRRWAAIKDAPVRAYKPHAAWRDDAELDTGPGGFGVAR